LPVWIRVEAVPGHGSSMVLHGGYGTLQEKPVAVVFLNGNVKAEEIYLSTTGSAVLADQMYPLLIHELTHAADTYAPQLPSKSMADAQDHLDSYYNSPGEVRAYLQEVVDEVERFLPNYQRFVRLFHGDGKAVEVLLKNSETWKKASPHWTETNRRLVIKAVAQRIQAHKDEEEARARRGF
jgi:hypothetical protein